MSLLKEINDTLRDKDEVTAAMEAVDASNAKISASECAEYMNPKRVKDFATAIANLMDDGMSYGEAKAEVFDETQVPPSNSPCCKLIRSMVVKIQKHR